jgi:N-acetyl-alpha-D-muramate 1-phosphate uridylyltransferase
MSLPVTAMIMAAGKGTRMMPLTADRPKPLVEVAGVKLIDHVLDHLRAAGVQKLVVNVHYLADQMEQHLRAAASDFALTVSDERAVLRDTGGGLMQARDIISSDPFLCINADNWWTNSATNALTSFGEAWDDATMDVLMLVVPTARANNTQGHGDFHMDKAGRLSRRIPPAAAPYVWTGIQILSKRILVDPPSDVFSTNIFWDRAIAKGRCHGVVHDGSWFDVGYPQAIPATEAAIASG